MNTMRRRYFKKIFKILSATDNPWILNEIYRFVVNITK